MTKRTRKRNPEQRSEPVSAARSPEPELEREIAEDFLERQNLSVEGREQKAAKLREHHQQSPSLSAGDVDAAWETARESGEETFTGHAPTPDQDRVDEMGAAAGLTYKDAELLQYSKVARRDERRWELDARSGAAEQAMDEESDDDDDEDVDTDDAPLRFWDLADDLDAEVDDVDDEDEDDLDEADSDEPLSALPEDEVEDDEADVDTDASDDDPLDADDLGEDLDAEEDDSDDDEED